MNRALVLGGGGAVGSAWESGILCGLAEADVDVRESDLIVGTSAGSQVGALVASGESWERLGARPHEALPAAGVGPTVSLPWLIERYGEIQTAAEGPEDWLRRLGAFARGATTLSAEDRRHELGQRLGLKSWPRRFTAVGIDASTGERLVWTKDSGADVISAIAASSALPGVWPCIEVGGRLAYDGGAYSMENADLALGHQRVLILCLDVPIATPFPLAEQVEALERSGSEVRVVRPDASVRQILHRGGGNLTDPALRGPIADAAAAQGRALGKELAAFWNAGRS